MKRIYLNKDLNPDYYSIVEGYNKLMEKWNNINSNIHNFKIPKIFLFITKKKLKKIGVEGAKLQKEYLEWNKRASKFLFEPNYFFESNQEEKELAYLHFTNNLQFLINSMHEYMVLLTTNYNNRYSQYREQLNFIIAISAFLIGIFGFIISSYSTFLNPNYTITKYNKVISLKLDAVNNKIDSLVNLEKIMLEKEKINHNILLKLNMLKPNKRMHQNLPRGR